MTLTVTLLVAAAAVALNIWLSSRISALRQAHNVSVGDGGNEALLRRMRAQANYIENAPFFLILLGALELSGGNRLFLAGVSVIFLATRVAHAFGMDGGAAGRWRSVGMIGQTLALLGLASYAAVVAILSL
ncbi:MAG: MAPEG family protein [Sphingomicrobium sp.]